MDKFELDWKRRQAEGHPLHLAEIELQQAEEKLQALVDRQHDEELEAALVAIRTARKNLKLPRADLVHLRMYGGEHLGAAREYIKTHFRRGDAVTWGSTEELSVQVCELERMASVAAAAGIDGYVKQHSVKDKTS